MILSRQYPTRAEMKSSGQIESNARENRVRAGGPVTHERPPKWQGCRLGRRSRRDTGVVSRPIHGDEIHGHEEVMNGRYAIGG